MAPLSRRSMLLYTFAGLASSGAAVAQFRSARQRTYTCFPDAKMSDSDTDTAQRLRCLEAELRGQGAQISLEILPGRTAFQTLERKRLQGGAHFVIGGLNQVGGLLERRGIHDVSTDEILTKATTIDGRDWLTYEAELSEFCESEPVFESLLKLEFRTAFLCLLGRPLWRRLAEARTRRAEEEEDWPVQVEPKDSIYALQDNASEAVRTEVVTASIDTDDWTTAAAVLKFGGWNACPPPEVHVAVWRHWRERHGIQFVSAQEDLLEFSVGRPPTDHESAVELALDQYRYCNDIFDQGVGSVGALAAVLMESPYWYFWWD